jgi:CDP-glucose 4,6-dehydratase
MRYYVTGHTGFKGAWLIQLLHASGHLVSGQSVDPLRGSLFERAHLHEVLQDDFRIDIRDALATRTAMISARPDVVIHLAAQPLVRTSYDDPLRTFSTNVNGTLNVLDAVAHCPSIRALLVVTTDKVYRNVHKKEGYAEGDALGGDDPYSASKAMADLLTQSWVKSFPNCPTAIARAGNVIGGGDISPDRLLPDLIKGFRSGRGATLRYPQAVRPWQHVLDCLAGYLTLSDALVAGTGGGEWNFGPQQSSHVTVREVADLAAHVWGEGAAWDDEIRPQPREASLLSLNSEKAENELDWRPRLHFTEAVRWTLEWESLVGDGEDPADVCNSQIERHRSLSCVKDSGQSLV